MSNLKKYMIVGAANAVVFAGLATDSIRNKSPKELGAGLLFGLVASICATKSLKYMETRPDPRQMKLDFTGDCAP